MQHSVQDSVTGSAHRNLTVPGHSQQHAANEEVPRVLEDESLAMNGACLVPETLPGIFSPGSQDIFAHGVGQRLTALCHRERKSQRLRAEARPPEEAVPPRPAADEHAVLLLAWRVSADPRGRACACSCS